MCHVSPTGGVDEARVEEHRVTLGQRELYEVLLIVLLECIVMGLYRIIQCYIVVIRAIDRVP
jgi:hypothetical protein